MNQRDRDEWARQVPQRRRQGPYRDYGWESGQSSIPEMRDPGIHLTDAEWEEVQHWRRENARDEERSMRELRGETGRLGGGFYQPRFGIDQNRNEEGWEELPRYRQDRRYRRERPGLRMGEPGYYNRRVDSLGLDDEHSAIGYYVEGYGRGFDDEGNFSVAWNEIDSGPYTGVGPKDYRRSDELIQEEICQRLTQHGQLDARDIEVEVHHGEVYLKGSVNSRNDKRRAEDAIRDIAGVWDIHNHITRQDRDQRSNRVDQVGESGVYPTSGPLPEGDAPVVDMKSWGDKG